MKLRRQFEEETGEPAIYNSNRVIGESIRVNHEYLEWLETKLQNTSSNNNYAKCSESLSKEIYGNSPDQLYSREEIINLVRKHFA